MNSLNMLNERRQVLRDKLIGRQNVYGSWTCFGHPAFSEIVCQADIDFVGIDMEHTVISLEQARDIIAACHAGGSLCLPRIAAHEEHTIKRLLDAGADGIIAPKVETAEEAEQLISWMKYPPEGVRGFGISRAQGYGRDFDEYAASWNSLATLIVQIETVRGVENVKDIVSVEGVAGAMIGPYDLSGSCGVPGELDHPKVVEAKNEVIRVCRDMNVACGPHIIYPDSENVREAFDAGFTFTVLGADMFIFQEWTRKLSGLLKTLES